MEDLLEQCLKKTEDMIKQLIEIEMGYINNNHPDFIDTLTSVQSAEKGDKPEQEEQFKFKEMHNGLPPQKKHHLDMVRNEVELYDSKILEPR